MAVLVHEGGIFVGNASDLYKFSGSVLHCARDPWWYEACLYESAVNKRRVNSQTVLLSRYNEMALNMVDAQHPKYFSDEMVNSGLDFITERLSEGDAVLVHCNMGISRSPSLSFLWMFEHGFLDDDFRYAVPQFREIYKDWAPANGVWQYIKARCENPKISESYSQSSGS